MTGEEERAALASLNCQGESGANVAAPSPLISVLVHHRPRVLGFFVFFSEFKELLGKKRKVELGTEEEGECAVTNCVLASEYFKCSRI